MDAFEQVVSEILWMDSYWVEDCRHSLNAAGPATCQSPVRQLVHKLAKVDEFS